jgi:hypothetical protein
VIVVDASGGGQYTEIQPAVDAAADGDLILVHAGHYGSVVIQGKSIHVSAAPGAEVLTDFVKVKDLALGNVFLDGLWIVASTPENVLLVTNCGASVRVRDCRLQGNASVTGVRLSNATDVALSGTDVRGGYDRAGLFASNSRIALYRCEVLGGRGSDECYAPDGQPGCELVNSSTIFFSDSTVVGGNGGSSGCCYPGDGGPGLHLTGSSIAYVLETSFAGGTGGEGDLFNCGLVYGEDGPDVDVESGSSLENIPPPARTFLASGIVREGCDQEVWIEGAPGDEVFLPRSARGTFVVMPSAFGIRHLADPPFLNLPPLVVLPASGHVKLRLPALDVGISAPFSSETTHDQLIARDAANAIAFGECAYTAVFDSSLSSPCQEPIFVDSVAPPGGDGRSWSTAYDDLSAGLAEADARRSICKAILVEVWVKEGVYRPAPPGGSRDDSFELPAGVAVYGGFSGVETCRFDRDPKTHPCVLSGDLNGDDGPDFANTSDNSYQVLVRGFGSVLAVIDGLVIRGGNATGTGEWGAGAELPSTRMIGCTIMDNQSSAGAAGVYGYDTEILRCAFYRNDTSGDGGGAYLGGASQAVDCIFSGNEANRGGGVYAKGYYGSPRLVQCVFSGNVGNEGAGAALESTAGHQAFEVSSCTFSRNIASSRGAALALLAANDLVVSNSIFWRNAVGPDVGESAQLSLRGGELQIDFCCVGGWTGALGGTGNFGANPQFVDANGGDDLYGNEDDDLRLLGTSACIDAGSNSRAILDPGAFGDPVLLDLEGLPRFVDDPLVPDSGEGVAPIVDMGAHEHPDS